jgi:hypothetical protein
MFPSLDVGCGSDSTASSGNKRSKFWHQKYFLRSTLWAPLSEHIRYNDKSGRPRCCGQCCRRFGGYNCSLFRVEESLTLLNLTLEMEKTYITPKRRQTLPKTRSIMTCQWWTITWSLEKSGIYNPLGCDADVSEERTASLFGNDVEDARKHQALAPRIFVFIDTNVKNKYTAWHARGRHNLGWSSSASDLL